MLTRLQVKALAVLAMGAFALLTPPSAPAEAPAVCPGGSGPYCVNILGSCADHGVADDACDMACGGPGQWSGYQCYGNCQHEWGVLIECF